LGGYRAIPESSDGKGWSLERFGFSLNRVISVVMTHVVIARSLTGLAKGQPEDRLRATWRSIAANAPNPGLPRRPKGLLAMTNG
jgi:hypothetical protein